MFFILGYFIDFSVKNIFFTELLNKYLGVMIIPVFLFLFFYGFIFLSDNKIKREVNEIRLYLSLILIICITFIFILFETGINFYNFQEFIIDEKFLSDFIENSIYKYKIGYFFTYIFYFLLSLRGKIKELLLVILGISVFSLFLIIFSPLKNYFKKKYLKYKEEKERLRKEKLLCEQIKIKEALDKKIRNKEMKFKENKEKIMQEKIMEFRKGVKLKKTITLENE